LACPNAREKLSRAGAKSWRYTAPRFALLSLIGGTCTSPVWHAFAGPAGFCDLTRDKQPGCRAKCNEISWRQSGAGFTPGDGYKPQWNVATRLRLQKRDKDRAKACKLSHLKEKQR